MGRSAISCPNHLFKFARLLREILFAFLLLTNAIKSSSQETIRFTSFGYHPGFDFSGTRIDKCKTYYDSTSHVLFNPCFDFRNRGIYSSYLARRVFLGDCQACDSTAVLLPHEMTSIDWKAMQHRQQQTWDYYFRLWQKQDKLEKYYINLEGIVRGSMK